MQLRSIGRSVLIGALATAALLAPGHTAALQQAVTCANEPYLARRVAAAATPEAIASPSTFLAASPAASPAGSPSASPAATPTPLTIAWLDTGDSPSAEAAVRRAAVDVAAHLIAPGAANATALKQSLGEGAQAVVIDAKAAASLVPELTAAANDGTDIVVVGADEASDGRRLDVVPPDGPAVAAAAAQWLSDSLGCTGVVLIVAGTRDDAALNDEATAAANEFGVYGVHVADVVYGNDDPDLSFTRAAQTMVAYPDLTGILALTPNGLAAATSAMTRMDRVDKVEVVGVAAPGAGTEASAAIVTSRPDDASELAIRAAAALVSGKITGASGEHFAAGPFGDVVVGNDSVVVAPPIVLLPPGGAATPTP